MTVQFWNLHISYGYLTTLIHDSLSLMEIELQMLAIAISVCEERRKGVNIATTIGSTIGLVSGACALAAVTSGAALPFITAPIAISGTASLSVSISSLIDYVGTYKVKKITTAIKDLHKIKGEQLQKVNEQLNEQLNKFKDDHLSKAVIIDGNHPSGSFVRMSAGIANNATMPPLLILRTTSVLTVAVGGVLSALGMVFDSAFLWVAIRNILRGNRTTFTTDQRAKMKLIEFAKRMYQVLLDGNKNIQ